MDNIAKKLKTAEVIDYLFHITYSVIPWNFCLLTSIDFRSSSRNQLIMRDIVAARSVVGYFLFPFQSCNSLPDYLRDPTRCSYTFRIALKRL